MDSPYYVLIYFINVTHHIVLRLTFQIIVSTHRPSVLRQLIAQAWWWACGCSCLQMKYTMRLHVTLRFQEHGNNNHCLLVLSFMVGSKLGVGLSTVCITLFNKSSVLSNPKMLPDNDMYLNPTGPHSWLRHYHELHKYRRNESGVTKFDWKKLSDRFEKLGKTATLAFKINCFGSNNNQPSNPKNTHQIDPQAWILITQQQWYLPYN